MTNTPYLRLHDRIDSHWQAVFIVFALIVASACAGLLSLRLDMSFRPLFASGAEIEGPTLEFEQTFGQSSGAWIAAIFENEGLQRADFVARLAQVSDQVAAMTGVDEALSLTTFKLPVWHEGMLGFTSPIPTLLLDEDKREFLDRQVDILLEDGRLSGWLVSEDGTRMLLAARLSAPMQELDARREVVSAFENLVRSEAGEGISLQFTGVSVVELGYEKQVLKDQLVATALTTIVLMLLLYATFRNVAAVAVCLVPVTIALTVTLGVMGWFGIPVTVINTTIPAVILAIGVADAVHMLTAWLEAHGTGEGRRSAVVTMLDKTGQACFFTTATTMGGFAALMTANLVAVGSFGLAVSIGIFTAWISNQLLLPWMMRRLDVDSSVRSGPINRFVDTWMSVSARVAKERQWTVVIAGFVFVAVCAVLIPRLDIDQRFNEELPASHPVAVGQAEFEKDFGGFLGPDISIRKRDGSSVLDDRTQTSLASFSTALEALPETRHVWSAHDLLTDGLMPEIREVALSTMRDMPALTQRVDELISEDQAQLAVLVRVGDIGTLRAAAYRDEIVALIDEYWSEDYEVDVVGQWWLAQHGMRLLLSDMLISLFTALLIVLPLMWLALRDGRIFVAAALTNVLPLMLPLAFMVLADITLRIGTAVVLAIALGVVVDNTIHIVVRMRDETRAGGDIGENIGRAMRSTGRAVVFTTLALAGGFLSMMFNDLLAIRDMGLVAAITIIGAMLADLLFLPAFYLLTREKRQ